jgi:hypothetical protein
VGPFRTTDCLARSGGIEPCGLLHQHQAAAARTFFIELVKLVAWRLFMPAAVITLEGE